MANIISIFSGVVTTAGIFATLLYLSLKNDNFIFFRIAGYFLPGDEKPGSGAFRYPLGWLFIFAFSVIVGVGIAGAVFSYLKKGTP